MALSKRLVPPLFVLLWATGFIGARYAMPWAEPFTFLAARFAVAFAILGAMLLMWRSRRVSLTDAMHAVIAGVLMHGIYLGGVFWAIHHGMPAGISALIVGLQPLITAILAGRLLGERILPRHWLGLALGFVGVITVLSPKFGAIGGGVTSATLAAAVVSVVAMSVGTIWQKRFGGDTDPVSSALYQYLGAPPDGEDRRVLRCEGARYLDEVDHDVEEAPVVGQEVAPVRCEGRGCDQIRPGRAVRPAVDPLRHLGQEIA